MSLSKIVKIAELHPSGVANLTKEFADDKVVENPYDIEPDSSGLTKRAIQKLWEAVQGDDDFSRYDFQKGPFAENLDRLVTVVNEETTKREDYDGVRVPDNIRFAQLAYLQSPVSDGKEFSYGLLLHFGHYTGGHEPMEMAVLLPRRKDANTTPALLLSNNFHESDVKGLEVMTEAVRYGHQKMMQHRS